MRIIATKNQNSQCFLPRILLIVSNMGNNKNPNKSDACRKFQLVSRILTRLKFW